MDKRYTAPSYYAEGRRFEPKDVIYALSLNFNVGSTVKYISRAGYKPGNSKYDDLSKAYVFLGFEIEELKKKGNNDHCKEGMAPSPFYSTYCQDVLNDWDLPDNLESAMNYIFEYAEDAEAGLLRHDLTQAQRYINEELNNTDKPVDEEKFAKQFLDEVRQKKRTKILDDTEKRYLEGVLRPWKNTTISVEKTSMTSDSEYLRICINGASVSLPDFNAGQMYKGMKLGTEYSAGELGLFK